MKKITILLALFSQLFSPAFSQVGDALKGYWPVTDKTVMKSLNGQWNLKVIKGISDDKEIPNLDSSWGTIPVPGCWEAYGFCEPRYSFPDSLTGYYRTEFSIPKEWKGQRIVIRLDGVLRGYDLWLNDKFVGSWEQAYNTCLFDITPFLSKKGPQKLAMRVYSRFKGHEFDNHDDWAPMGIFRDITLFATPKTHLSDLTVTTKITGDVNIEAQVAKASKHTSIEYTLTDADGKSVANATAQIERNDVADVQKTTLKVHNPLLWTAETPYLYNLTVCIKEKNKVLQTFSQKVGIRELTTEHGNILTLNGKPIKMRGVTCHSTDPRTVKVIGDTLTLKDMQLMKEASVNYIRTSHYPREPRFFDLCDSLGFYVICEAPFGSRGQKHLSDPGYYDILQTRVKSTIEFHKNHPSVLIWSLGNENPLPKSCQRLGEYAQQLDPSRPYCFPQKGSTFRGIGFNKFPKQVPIYAPHYPTVSNLRSFFTKTDKPMIFTEYNHSLGISFENHDVIWEIIEKTPGIAGGSVWEWVDQGMPFRTHRSDRYGYEERVFTSQDGGFEMNGNQGTDGLLYANRVPLPNYYELQHNYAQAMVLDSLVRLTDRGIELPIRNRYDFINLKDNVFFDWTITADRDTLSKGRFSPDCSARNTVSYLLKTDMPSDKNKLIMFCVSISDKEGRVMLHQNIPLNKVDIKDRLLAELKPSGNPNDFVQTGTLIRVGRKVTMAERIIVGNKRIEKYLQPINNKYVAAKVKTTKNGACQQIDFTLTPDTTRRFLSELGVAYLLDSSIDRIQWIGNGPYPTYPGRHQANRYGFWSLQKDDIYFEGNRMGVDAMWLSDKEGNGILLLCDHGNVNVEQTDRGIVLTYNAAVSGEGPKFGNTPYGVWSNKVGTKEGSFLLYKTEAENIPSIMNRLFTNPSSLSPAFNPFYTQYDTYLMRYNDIISDDKTQETAK